MLERIGFAPNNWPLKSTISPPRNTGLMHSQEFQRPPDVREYRILTIPVTRAATCRAWNGSAAKGITFEIARNILKSCYTPGINRIRAEAQFPTESRVNTRQLKSDN